MTDSRWPSFETRDLDFEGDPDGADAEMRRRWDRYERDMRALIARGGVHRDRDGWWVDDASGELIGPDPEIERPSTPEELATARPINEILPELAAALRRGPGRPRLEAPRKAVTLRLAPEALAKFETAGPDWRRRMAEIIEAAAARL